MKSTSGSSDNDFTIRIPLEMIQLTKKDGQVWPIAFDWPDMDGIPMRVNIDKILSVASLAEQKSGTVGDRYECEIGGKIEHIYYTKLSQRKWFKVMPVSEQEYKDYYKLPGDGG